MAQTFVQFIDQQGGVSAVAKATGYGAGAVALWRHRNKIPRGAWPEVVEAYPDLSLAGLKELESASGVTTPRPNLASSA